MKEMEMKCAQEESHMIYTRVMLLCPTSEEHPYLWVAGKDSSS